MRSGAPSTASEATEPANIPNSKPRSAAMRAETASCTEAGCTHALPARIPRNRVRRALQRDGIFVILPGDGDRGPGLPRATPSGQLGPELAMIVATVSGQSCADLLKDRIFDPLGMKHTVAYDQSRPTRH